MLTRTQLLPMFLVALLSSATTLAATLLLFPPPTRAAPDLQAPVSTIRTQRLELVNAAGQVRGVLFVHPTGGGALTLTEDDRHGSAVELTATTGSGGIVLRDASARVRTGLNAGGRPSIYLADEVGRATWQVP